MGEQENTKLTAEVAPASPAPLTKRELYQQRMLKRKQLMRDLRASRVPRTGGCAPCQAKRKARNLIKDERESLSIK